MPIPYRALRKANLVGWTLGRRMRLGRARPVTLPLLLLALGGCQFGRQRPLLALPILPADSAAVRGLDAVAIEREVTRVLTAAALDSAFPGAFAVVGSRRGVLAQHAVGRLDWRERRSPDASTVWDLASLTKIVALTSAILHLVQQGRLDLDAPVQRYLPEWTGPEKELVRIRDLLAHSSGLPSWRPLYKEATSPGDALALALATPLDTTPRTRMVYSDIGAIVLGQVVTRITAEPLDQYVTRQILEPMGMQDSRFRPARSWRRWTAPTEIDPWRQRHLRAEVHDENAFALGGVSAHAGLFSTAHDMARFAMMYLNDGILDGVRVLDSATIHRFTGEPESPLSHRALGWEKPSGTNSGGRFMSPAAYGHTGFTGTSLWIDPAHDVFVLLLTNRVNPTRENRRIGEVRIALADAVMRVVLGCGSPAHALECPVRDR